MIKRQVFYTDEFQRQVTQLAKHYRHLRDDVEPVIQQIAQGETPGDRLQGVARPVFKVRIRNSDAQRGKRGGYRLLYYLRDAPQVVLLALYSKSDRGNLETREVIRFLQRWEEEHS